MLRQPLYFVYRLYLSRDDELPSAIASVSTSAGAGDWGKRRNIINNIVLPILSLLPIKFSDLNKPNLMCFNNLDIEAP